MLISDHQGNVIWTKKARLDENCNTTSKQLCLEAVCANLDYDICHGNKTIIMMFWKVVKINGKSYYGVSLALHFDMLSCF